MATTITGASVTTGEVTFSDTTSMTTSFEGTRPAFYVKSSSVQSTPTNGGYVNVVFDNEILDTANAFASNTFTAPRDGVYSFNTVLSIMGNNGEVDDTMYWGFAVDGTNTHMLRDNFHWATVAGSDYTASHSIIMELTAGQTVSVRVGGMTQTACELGASYCHFSGHLLDI